MDVPVHTCKSEHNFQGFVLLTTISSGNRTQVTRLARHTLLPLAILESYNSVSHTVPPLVCYTLKTLFNSCICVYVSVGGQQGPEEDIGCPKVVSCLTYMGAEI